MRVRISCFCAFLLMPFSGADADTVMMAVRIQYSAEVDAVWINTQPIHDSREHLVDDSILAKLEADYGLHTLRRQIVYEDDQIIEVKPIAEEFSTPEGMLEVTIEPVPGNRNSQGRCGAHIGAKFSITLNDELKVKDRVLIDSDCFTFDGTYRGFSYEVDSGLLLGR